MNKSIAVPPVLTYQGSAPGPFQDILLEPLTQAHAADLAKACQDGELWLPVITTVPSPDMVESYIDHANSMADRVAFAVIDTDSKKAIGTTSLYAIRPEVKRLNIGYTWYAKSYWRTHVNTVCKMMLLRYAFETLGYLTVGWRTDVGNLNSQRAIERLGAKKDGIVRGDRVRQDGVISDSVVYSMTAEEWKQAKLKLEDKLQHYVG
ncbi:GNAT family N-acetyltransferase [Psychrobacter sp. FDAARGOS_221]|uniref:GNAT family N-acetyltransferase n=1 Tax=Psychrobacter sp. FDAARGOS_221 TaxID=1975705 RepID=UPI000BB5793A|nr:GNAT family protein [Psychrobacter sp. FDAARGOS_221]PNK60918.1 N-acetyltransferase [Psychrobacter sp. FDAARGOS_221]